MAFQNGSNMTLWKEVDNRGRNYIARYCTTSKKDKRTGEYTTDFGSIVKFIGKAKDVVSGMGESDHIRIDECAVSNTYNKEKDKTYWECAVFSCEKLEKKNNGQGDKPVAQAAKNHASETPVLTDDSGDDLPF